ncbi:hypothetical protein ALC60_09604 [Trachymyrmex zeteki]|uniref:Uncharacterized protein n=1 Tax=Mycetomoellerius zeteki TaxID=64791 RepID=A0A151WTY4_9HYME|nr:hypothetical protein ALC60_09604 [Trachymyrmex zeteki]
MTLQVEPNRIGFSGTNSQEREREPKRTTIRLGDTRINLRLGPGALALARLTLGEILRCRKRLVSQPDLRDTTSLCQYQSSRSIVLVAQSCIDIAASTRLKIQPRSTRVFVLFSSPSKLLIRLLVNQFAPAMNQEQARLAQAHCRHLSFVIYVLPRKQKAAYRDEIYVVRIVYLASSNQGRAKEGDSSRGSVRCCEPGALTSFHGKPDVGVDYLPYLAALFSGFGLRTAHGVLCGLFSDRNNELDMRYENVAIRKIRKVTRNRRIRRLETWSEDRGEKENRSQSRLRAQKTKLASFSRIDNVNKMHYIQKSSLPSDFLDNPNAGGSRLHPRQLLQSDSGSLLKLHSESSSKRSESSKEKRSFSSHSIRCPPAAALPPVLPPPRPPPPPPPLPEDRARLPASFNYRANQHTRKYERVLDGYLPPCPPRRISSARIPCSGVNSTTAFPKTCIREKTTFHIAILIATFRFQYNLHKACSF